MNSDLNSAMNPPKTSTLPAHTVYSYETQKCLSKVLGHQNSFGIDSTSVLNSTEGMKQHSFLIWTKTSQRCSFDFKSGDRKCHDI